MYRTILLLLLLFFCLGESARARGQNAASSSDADPLRQQLTDALAEYREDVQSALTGLLHALDKQFEQAQKKGDFEAAKAYKTAKEDLQSKGKMPPLPALRAERFKTESAVARAQGRLAMTYEEVRKAYTKKKDFEKAEIVDKEMKALKSRFLEQPTKTVTRNVTAEVFLTDLQEQKLDPPSGGFGKHGKTHTNEPIRVEETMCPKGILLNADSNSRRQVTYSVPAGFVRFRTHVGIHNNGSPSATALIFKVLDENDKELWVSDGVASGRAASNCDIEVKTTQTITLVVECPGSCHNANGIWLDPRFVR